MELRVTVDGAEQVARNLRIPAQKLQRPAEFYRQAIILIEARINQVFAEQGSSVEHAGAWPQLAESTMKARTRRWGYYKNTPSNPSILRWTGAMQDHRIVTVNEDKGRIEFIEPYAVYHQRGSGDRPPQRMFIDIDDATATEITRALQKYIFETDGMSGIRF
jgi:phage gpG-like protein